MAKKNSTLGKLLAFTTAVAAIGGACYIFRDQIKESEIYKKSADKLSALRNKISDKLGNEEDDFFFDDDFEDDFEDDVFSDNAKNNREYTSITINPKENITETVTDATEDVADAIADVQEDITETSEDLQEDVEDVVQDVAKDFAEESEDMKEIFSDTTIPTITFGSSASNKKDDFVLTDEISGYENQGLSDVDEDPDVLADQDRLDF